MLCHDRGEMGIEKAATTTSAHRIGTHTEGVVCQGLRSAANPWGQNAIDRQPNEKLKMHKNVATCRCLFVDFSPKIVPAYQVDRSVCACCCCCCSHINSLTKESVVTQRCWSPRKIRKTKKNRKFACLKIHETKKAHTR